MILLTNGCSWTYGGGLELDRDDQTDQRLESVWPHHLGKLLGADKVVNLAAGCGSNQRIFRTTFDWIAKNNDPHEKIIAVIQFTEPSRYEFYHTNDPYNDFSNISENWARVKVGTALGTVDDDPKIQKMLQDRFYFNTIIEDMYSLVLYCSALSDLFKQHNIEYYFWRAFMTTDIPNELDTYISKNFPFMDYECKWQYERIGSHDTHPGLLGHKQIAAHIHESINSSRVLQ